MGFFFFLLFIFQCLGSSFRGRGKSWSVWRVNSVHRKRSFFGNNRSLKILFAWKTDLREKRAKQQQWGKEKRVPHFKEWKTTGSLRHCMCVCVCVRACVCVCSLILLQGHSAVNTYMSHPIAPGKPESWVVTFSTESCRISIFVYPKKQLKCLQVDCCIYLVKCMSEMTRF